MGEASASQRTDRIGAGAVYVLVAMTLIHALNIADRFVVSTLIEPIKHEFRLSDGAWADNPKVKTSCFPVTVTETEVRVEVPD